MNESEAIALTSKFTALRAIEIWCMGKVNTSPIRTNYSHRSTSSTTTISIERTHVFVISVRASAGTLIEATAYTALNEHGHINVSEQLESYMRMFQHDVLRETW